VLLADIDPVLRGHTLIVMMYRAGAKMVIVFIVRPDLTLAA
jgi:hypothetical protein